MARKDPLTMRCKPIYLTTVSMLLAIVLSGCQQSASAPAPDSTIAEVTLRQALETWKKGEPQTTLAQLSPPLTFADRQWAAGDILLDFTILGEPVVTGNTQLFQVRLQLKQGSKSQTIDVPYLAYEAETLSISRVEQ
jgi:hypothetical protein